MLMTTRCEFDVNNWRGIFTGPEQGEPEPLGLQEPKNCRPTSQRPEQGAEQSLALSWGRITSIGRAASGACSVFRGRPTPEN